MSSHPLRWLMFDRAILDLPKGRLAFCITACLSLLQAFDIFMQAYSLSFAIVSIWEGQRIESVIGWIVCFFICFVVRQVIACAQSRFMETFADKTTLGLREQFLSALFRLGPAFTRTRGSAACAADAIEGIDKAHAYISIIVVKAASVICIPLVLLVCMFCFDWVSGVIALVCYPFIILFMKLIGMSAGEEAKKRHSIFEEMTADFVDITKGVATIKAHSAEDTFSKKIFEGSEKFRELTLKTLRIAMLSSTVLDIFSTLALAAVAIMLGFRLVEGSMDFLPALIVLMLVPEYFKPIREFGEDYHSTTEGKAALDSINAIIALPVSEDGAHLADRPRINMETIFDFDPEDIAGKKIGIFGQSGAGKTTLLNELAGFGVQSEDLRTDTIAYIPQDPYIFNTTLRENVAFYCPESTDDEIWACLDAVGLAPFVSQLPDGLDTVIGNGGRPLSGGQAQRIVLARALLDNKRNIWLLDEPTAHLDVQTESELKSNLLDIMEGKTVYLATHRLHWKDDVDYIVEIEPSHLKRHETV